MSNNAERVTYRAVVLDNTIRRSKNKGTPSVNILAQCMYPVDDPDKKVKLRVYGDLWLTYGAMDRSISTLQKVFGWEGTQISELNQGVLTGKQFEAVVEFDPEYLDDDGNPRPSIAFFNAIRSMKRADPEELSSIVDDVQSMVDEVMGTKAAPTQNAAADPLGGSAANNQAAGAYPPGTEEAPPPSEPEDLPF